MGAKCSDLKNTDNPCEIGKCIKKLRGLPSNSASPSDIFVVHFNDGTKYNDKDIYNAFMKIFISPQSENFNSIDLSRGLEYELKIYTDVVTNLLDYNICPNYIRCYSTSKDCSFFNIRDILSNGLENAFGPGNEIMYENMIVRSYYFMANNKRSRPAIESDIIIPVPNTEEVRIKAENAKYDFIINESVFGSTTLYDFLEDFKDDTIIAYKILFQIFCACYGLSLMKTNHGDLHTDNVFIQKIEETTFHYNINGTIYSLKTNYLVKIFDYDRSYCENIGKNPLLRDIKTIVGFSNVFVPNKDIWQVVFWCTKIPDIFSLIAKEEKYIDDFKNLRNGKYFQFNDNTMMTVDYIKESTCSIEETLLRTAEKLRLKNEYNGGTIYTLNTDLFDNGYLQVDKIVDLEIQEFENIKEYKKSDYRALYNILEKSNSHKFSL